MQHLNHLTIYCFADNNSSLEKYYLLLLFEKSCPYLLIDMFSVRLKGFHLSVKFVPKIG